MSDKYTVPLNLIELIKSYQQRTNSEFIRETGNEFVTFSGARINPLNFSRRDVRIDDIAQGLSNLCRYGGQCHRFYSVAEHSVLTSRYIEELSFIPGLPASGLFHDASEAYLVDLPKPFKILCPGYEILESHFSSAIFEAFGLGFRFDHPVIKEIDHRLYRMESRILFPGRQFCGSEADLEATGGTHKIECLSPELAKKAFLERVEELDVKAVP